MSEIILFLKGTGRSKDGRGKPYYTRQEIMGLSDREIESKHDIIQWMFPLPEPSGFNRFAPILTPKDIALLECDDKTNENILALIDRMLEFYGIETEDSAWFLDLRDRNIIFSYSPELKYKHSEWVQANNHNFLRITRMLRFLNLLGYKKVSQSLFKVFEKIYEENKPIINDSTYIFWQMACGLRSWNPESVK